MRMTASIASAIACDALSSVNGGATGQDLRLAVEVFFDSPGL